MKANVVREILAKGGMPLGHMLMEFHTRGIAKVTEAAGIDFVLIDMEHSGADHGRVADLIAWYKATRVAPFVRVPGADYHWIARLMDAGALGIMVPNVLNADHARQAVNAMKYGPAGQRGLGLGTAHNDFIPPKPREYMDYANANTFLICQIESEEGVANADEIARIEGVDCLWVGHFDLTQSMGIVAEFQNPKFQKALRAIPEVCNRHGKVAGIQPGNLDQAREWIDAGYRLISYGADFMVYSRALSAAVEALRG